MNLCPICFESILQVNTASPDVCDHIFCLTCLTKWSKHESFCPIDRKRFKKIIRLDSKTPIEIKRHKRKKASPLYDVTAYCEICKTSDNGDTLLLCDCCDLGYHCACLTPKLPSVPPGRWFCPTCVFVDKKLKKKKNVKKAPKSISRKEKFSRRSYPRPGTSNMFSKSSNYPISKPSVPNESSSDLEIQPKKPQSYSSRDLKGRFSSSNKFKSKRRNCNNNISVNQSQNNGVLVSEQDYQLLNNDEKFFILPDISLSPKTGQSNSFITSSRKEDSSRTKNKFSVFEKSDNFHVRLKFRRILDFSEANGNKSKVSYDVSEMPGSSGDCSISSDISGTENCDLNQQCDQLQLNTKSTGESTQSPEQNSEMPSACGKDKSSRYPGLNKVKVSETGSQPNALCDDSLNKIKIDESDVMENPLVDFESRNSQYALKAKISLQEELLKMEREKWKYFKPLKKLKSLSFPMKDCENLLDFPKKGTSFVEEKLKSGLGCNVFNIEEYKERVRRGTWRPENIVILEQNKSIASDKHRQKIQMKKQLGTCCSLNVFQVPDSHNKFVANKKRQGYMASFNPLHSKKSSDDRSTLEGKLLHAALHRDVENLSMRYKKHF